MIAIRSSIQRLMDDHEAAAFRCFVCRTGPKALEPFSPRSQVVSVVPSVVQRTAA